METNVNIKAYNDFYKKNQRALFNFIFKMTHNVEVSEELVNDAMLKVYQNLHRFDETKSQFKTWVYNIASNATIDYLRKRKLETKSMQDVLIDNNGEESGEMDFASEDATPLEVMISAESQAMIDKAMKSELSKQQSEIMTMYALGFSYENIADELKMPIGTVKGSLHMARTRMREFFNKPVTA